jgi:hypothetical protein
MAVQSARADPIMYGTCQAACNAGWVACVVAAYGSMGPIGVGESHTFFSPAPVREGPGLTLKRADEGGKRGELINSLLSAMLCRARHLHGGLQPSFGHAYALDGIHHRSSSYVIRHPW